MNNKKLSKLAAVTDIKDVIKADALSGTKSGTKQISKENHADLLLLKERRIERLEQEMAKLVIHSDDLQKCCEAQLEVIEVLKARRETEKNTAAIDSDVWHGGQTQHAKKAGIQLSDLPGIDKAEFLPVDNDTPSILSVGQAGQRIMNGVLKVMF